MRFRTQFLNLLSHVFSFTVIFAILSGFFEDGTRATPYFLIASFIALFLWLEIAKKFSPYFRLLIGIGVYLCGAFGWSWLEEDVNSAHLTLYFIFGLSLLYRMGQAKINFQYLQDQLARYYSADLLVMIVLAFITWFYARDPAWQTTALSFFIAYLLTRLWTLSSAVQIEQGGQGKFSRLIFFTMFPAAILGMLVIKGFGFSVLARLWDLILYLAKPIFYVGGMLSLAFVNFLSRSPLLNELREENYDGSEGTGDKEEISTPPLESSFHIPEWISIPLIVILILIFVWVIYRKWKRKGATFFREGYLEEVREFIPRRQAPKKIQFIEATTPMRMLYQQFLKLMQKREYFRKVGETPLEYGKRVGANYPEEKPWIMELTQYYIKDRYGKKVEEKELQKAVELLSKLNKKKK